MYGLEYEMNDNRSVIVKKSIRGRYAKAKGVWFSETNGGAFAGEDEKSEKSEM